VELRALGPVRHGRCARQPSREQLRAFFRNADRLLNFKPLWFDAAMREAIGRAFGQVVAERAYTVWACAACSNHAHLCVRVHRDDAITIRDAFANASRLAIAEFATVQAGHSVWSSRPYKVYLDTVEAVGVGSRLHLEEPD
jgi:hypothetical protein